MSPLKPTSQSHMRAGSISPTHSPEWMPPSGPYVQTTSGPNCRWCRNASIISQHHEPSVRPSFSGTPTLTLLIHSTKPNTTRAAIRGSFDAGELAPGAGVGSDMRGEYTRSASARASPKQRRHPLQEQRKRSTAARAPRTRGFELVLAARVRALDALRATV